jgi:SAM-dependent methyltransferase
METVVMAASDLWTSGDPYERYVGRWSRQVARHFLAWLNAPQGLDWLDVGCGTGALAGTIATDCAPGRLVGVDQSAGFLATARQGPAGGCAEFYQADAGALPFPDGAFDRVVSGLVLNFLPDPAQALAEMARVARTGGEVALYVWDYAGRMEMMHYFWRAAVSLDPDAAAEDQARRFPICRADALQRLFEESDALAEIATQPLELSMVFADFDDYWNPFLGGQGPAPSYCKSLPEEQRIRLRQRLQETLPIRPDGSIHLRARALAVRGRKTEPMRNG